MLVVSLLAFAGVVFAVAVVVQVFVECRKNVGNGLSVVLRVSLLVCHASDERAFFDAFCAGDPPQIFVLRQDTLYCFSASCSFDRTDLFAYAFVELVACCCLVVRCVASLLE